MAAPTHGQQAPGPRGNPLVGSIGPIGRDPLGFLTETHDRYGDLVRLRFGVPGRRIIAHLLAHPDAVEQVLQKNHRAYRRAPTYDVLALFIGEGMLTSDGESWVTSRRVLQPAFSRERLTALVPEMTAAAEAVAERWAGLARTGTRVDVAREMMALTLRILARIMFSTALDEEEALVARALPVVMDHAIRKMTLRAPFPLVVPTPDNLRARRAEAALDGVVARLVARRRREGGPEDDALGLLLAAEAAGVPGVDEGRIRSELLTLLIAGHETTAVLLSWTWAHLAASPEAEAALHAEVDAVLGGRAATGADLPALEVTRRVLSESLRLHPPAYVVERLVAETDRVMGVTLPEGSVVITSPWVTHRSPRYWPAPLRFDPDRFSPEQSAGRHPYAWFPFGGGPRRCIGEHFALMEARLVLATLAGRFRVQPVSRDLPRPEPLVTLRPRGGLPGWIEAR